MFCSVFNNVTSLHVVKSFGHISIDFINATLSRNHRALGGVGLDDRLGVLVEGDEPLLDGVDIVVSTSRSLCALEQPGCHGLIGHLEVEDVLARSNSFLKLSTNRSPQQT